MRRGISIQQMKALYKKYLPFLSSGTLKHRRLFHLKRWLILPPRLSSLTKNKRVYHVEVSWSAETWQTHKMGVQLKPIVFKTLIPVKIHRWQVRDSLEIVKKIGLLQKGGGKRIAIDSSKEKESSWEEAAPFQDKRIFDMKYS